MAQLQREPDPAPVGARTRERILDASERLMRTIGLGNTTTREIARAAGCSEATLYKYFSSKEELFAEVHQRLPAMTSLLAVLREPPGRRTLEQALTETARQAALFYEASIPLAASLFADPGLLERHREGLRPLDAGPHKPLQALAGFLEEQRAAGRIRGDADPDIAAALLLGACYQRAFLRLFMGEPARSAMSVAMPTDAFAATVARTLLTGLT